MHGYLLYITIKNHHSILKAWRTTTNFWKGKNPLADSISIAAHSSVQARQMVFLSIDFCSNEQTVSFCSEFQKWLAGVYEIFRLNRLT